MRQMRQIVGNAAPRNSVTLKRLGQPRLLAVMRVPRRDGVFHLHHLPLPSLFDGGPLKQMSVFPVKPQPFPWRTRAFHQRTILSRGGTAGKGSVIVLNRSMAVFAVDFDRVSRFTVQLAVAVHVLIKMAIYA